MIFKIALLCHIVREPLVRSWTSKQINVYVPVSSSIGNIIFFLFLQSIWKELFILFEIIKFVVSSGTIRNVIIQNVFDTIFTHDNPSISNGFSFLPWKNM